MTLGSLQRAILTALEDEPVAMYAKEIHGRIVTSDGQLYAPNSIIVVLKRLAERELLTSYWSGSFPIRGGRRRRYFRISNLGREALRQARLAYRHKDAAE